MLKSKTHKLANWRWAFQRSQRNATVKIVQSKELPSRWKEKLIIACWGKISLALELIPRGKKLSKFSILTFLQCSQPVSLSKNTFKKIGHCACLRDMVGPNLPHLCLYWHLSRASFHRFMVYFCGSWKQVFLKKHFIVRKSRAYGTIRYTICGKNHSILDGIDLSSSCFQGHLHLRVTGLHIRFMYILFSLR